MFYGLISFHFRCQRRASVSSVSSVLPPRRDVICCILSSDCRLSYISNSFVDKYTIWFRKLPSVHPLKSSSMFDIVIIKKNSHRENKEVLYSSYPNYLFHQLRRENWLRQKYIRLKKFSFNSFNIVALMNLQV